MRRRRNKSSWEMMSVCEYCNRADGGHFVGCPNEPETDMDEGPDFMDEAKKKIEEAMFNWDDERWNK